LGQQRPYLTSRVPNLKCIHLIITTAQTGSLAYNREVSQQVLS